MSDMMTFPETWGEFEKSYGFIDIKKVYTNGSRLIQSFRVKQWLDHIAQSETKRQATVSSDCISRQAALDLPIKRDICWFDGSVDEWINVEDIKELPSAEPERKKGYWIKKEPTIKELHGCYYECSKCHKFSLPFQKLNFCPNCGSYNGGEEE